MLAEKLALETWEAESILVPVRLTRKLAIMVAVVEVGVEGTGVEAAKPALAQLIILVPTLLLLRLRGQTQQLLAPARIACHQSGREC